MFNILYRCPRTVARHQNGPLHESRRCYLEHLSAQGAALHTLRAAAGIIYRAAIWMRLDESSPVERRVPQVRSWGMNLGLGFYFLPDAIPLHPNHLHFP
jgi:hypothetical protein